MSTLPIAESAACPDRLHATVGDEGTTLTLQFPGDLGAYRFSANWLRDADHSTGSSISYEDSFYTRAGESRIAAATPVDSDVRVKWKDTEAPSFFPAAWLYALGGRVADSVGVPGVPRASQVRGPSACTTGVVPEVSWDALMSATRSDAVFQDALTTLVAADGAQILRVTGAPRPTYESEQERGSNLGTQALTHLFGTVMRHPRRGVGLPFTVTSRGEADARKVVLDNYNVTKRLGPHSDHVHYAEPASQMSLVGVEGVSTNTWHGAVDAAEKLRAETPEKFKLLSQVPMGYGRVGGHYSPTLLQSAEGPMIELGPQGEIRRVRMHPHLATGLLVGPADYASAAEATRDFYALMSQAEFTLELEVRPGDVFLWNNARLTHGRKAVSTPIRTITGQTVPTSAVNQRWHEHQLAKIASLDESWLAHLPAGSAADVIQYEGIVRTPDT